MRRSPATAIRKQPMTIAEIYRHPKDAARRISQGDASLEFWARELCAQIARQNRCLEIIAQELQVMAMQKGSRTDLRDRL